MLTRATPDIEALEIHGTCDVRFGPSPVFAGCTVRADEHGYRGQERRIVYVRDLVGDVVRECRQRRGESQIY
jgi:hypothetical protein